MPDIPGYYYDEDKKKYFKIQKNHTVAVGSSGDRYSADNIKKRKIEAEAAREIETSVQRTKHKVKRAPLINNARLGLPLMRELGYGMRTCNADAATRILVGGWSRTEIFPASQFPTSQSFSTFAWDPVSRAVFLPGPDGQGLTAVPETSYNNSIVQRTAEQPGFQDQKSRYSRHDLTFIYRSPAALGAVATIDIDSTARLLLTSWSGTPTISVSRLRDTNEVGHNYIGDVSQEWLLGRNGDDYLDIFSSTTALPSSKFLYAVASQRGIHVLDRAENMHLLHRSRIEDSDVMAVQFLQSDPFLIVAGERSGKITIFDVRCSHNGYRSGHNGFLHPSSVSHIKEIDGSTIVVAGLHSTLCNYDRRYYKLKPRGNVWSKFTGSTEDNCTQPVLTYPEYSNDATLGLGFDTDNETGIVAAVQPASNLRGHFRIDTTPNIVNCYSSSTGKLIRSLEPSTVTKATGVKDTKGVKFVADRGENLPKSLWVGKGTSLVSYEW